MTVLLATMGHSAHFLLPLIDSLGGVERVLLLHPADDKGRRARSIAERACRSRGLPLEALAIESVGDPVAVALTVRTLLARLANERSVALAPQGQGETPQLGGPVQVHITHGLGALSSGALLACLLQGVAASYEPGEGASPARLPVLTLPYGDLFTPKQLEVLRALQRLGGAVRVKELRAALSKDRSTLAHHLGELTRLGAVELMEVPTNRREKVVRLQPNLGLLIPTIEAAPTSGPPSPPPTPVGG